MTSHDPGVPPVPAIRQPLAAHHAAAVDKARVAVFGASHWHAPLYREALLRRHEVVAVQDDAPQAVASPRAWGVEVSPDVDSVLRDVEFDAAYVMSPHDEVARVCLKLIERGIPFVVEKPLGVNLAELRAVVEAARFAGVAATVALVQRDGPVESWLRQAGTIAYERFSFHAGPPSRYSSNGSPWMLDPMRAGGGALVNLGPHFVDLALRHLGPGEVTALTRSHALHSERVEDHATVVLTGTRGGQAIIEVGYVFPDSPLKRFCSFSAAGDRGFASIDTDGTAQFTDLTGQTVRTTLDVDSDPLYEVLVDRVADTLATGFAGMPTLDDLAAAMKVIWPDPSETEAHDD
ncbi:putative dehydrogenase [Frigoribacterium sp. PvP054]|uniref:Gfo/Idh/MocA family protein n=1 Tax=Frigoribacterium sp. PvP054 TaxID=3156438 RepID=UPI0033968C00